MRISDWSSDVCSSDLLGDRCVAARLDGQLEPLNTHLRNGQTVEIITSRHARPNAAWLNFVKTAKARSAIRGYLRTQREDEAVRLGRRLLEIAMRELKIPPAALKDEARLQPVLRSEEHKSELQSLMRISYAVFCLKKKNKD